MAFADLITKTPQELQSMLAEARGRLRQLRLQRAVARLADVRSIREVRKEIAQILTAARATRTA